MAQLICPAPLGAFERAEFDVPEMACDCHAHVIAPAATGYPMAADRSYTPPAQTPEAYLGMLDGLGMQRGVLVQISVHGADNRYMLEALRADPRRLRGVAVVDAGVSDAALADMHACGVRGVRINTLFGGGVGMDQLERIAARIAPLGWHVQLLIDARDMPALLPRLRALPCPCVIDHFGHQPAQLGVLSAGFQALLHLARDHGAWVKLSGAYRISARPDCADVLPLAHALIEQVPDQLVWGSDWPHVAVQAMPDTGALLNLLARWAPDDGMRRRILADNPARLYQFE